MGYDNLNARRVVFDIETAPIAGANAFIEEPTAPSNYKDPEKIAAYIAEAKANAVSKCALDPDLARIVALAWRVEYDDTVHVEMCPGVGSESVALEQFWAVVRNSGQLVGYNCLAFDLPVLLRRSLYLHIAAPEIQIDTYRHPQVCDLQQVLSFNGKLKYHSLAFYAKRFGFDVDAPDDIDGSQISALVEAGDYDAVKRHVTADVNRTAMLAAKLGYFHYETAEVI